MRILYVEDNEVNQALVERVARAQTCEVIFREEGEEALKILAEDPAIDLILLDIELAGAITGLDVIKTLRARNDKRPVVAITAYAMMGDRERILNAGCDQYLPKPLVINDLLEVLAHYEKKFADEARTGTAETEPAAEPAKPAPASEATPAAETPVHATPTPATSGVASTPTPTGDSPATPPPTGPAAGPAQASPDTKPDDADTDSD